MERFNQNILAPILQIPKFPKLETFSIIFGGPKVVEQLLQLYQNINKFPKLKLLKLNTCSKKCNQSKIMNLLVQCFGEKIFACGVEFLDLVPCFFIKHYDIRDLILKTYSHTVKFISMGIFYPNDDQLNLDFFTHLDKIKTYLPNLEAISIEIEDKTKINENFYLTNDCTEKDLYIFIESQFMADADEFENCSMEEVNKIWIQILENLKKSKINFVTDEVLDKLALQSMRKKNLNGGYVVEIYHDN